MLRLAHEAVLRGWERARDIASKEQDFYRFREDVAAPEQRWRGKNRSDLLLAQGLPLAEAQSLRVTYGAELDPALVAFVDASTRKEQRRLRRGYGRSGDRESPLGSTHFRPTNAALRSKRSCECAVHGSKLTDMPSDWRPSPEHIEVPFKTSRRSTDRVRPPCLAGGIIGATIAHSSSVRSFG